MNIEDYERIFPTTELEGIIFNTPNTACTWRVQTLLSKEPDTIAWIRSLPAGATFLDVGANMGQYALVAAKHGLVVHAFEPDSQNFALLCRNIALNKTLTVTAWPLGLSNETGLFDFHVTILQYGSSCHSLGIARDFAGKPKDFAFRHGAMAYRLDDFCTVRGITPSHIKIDVDGLEPRVIAGLGNKLSDVQTMLIELNSTLPEHLQLIEQLRGAGFTYDEEQARRSRRTEGPFIGIGNIIFRRP